MQVQTASNALPPARQPSAEPTASGDGAFAQLLARQPEVETEPPPDAAAGSGSNARPSSK